jgi:hypothetical protein
VLLIELAADCADTEDALSDSSINPVMTTAYAKHITRADPTNRMSSSTSTLAVHEMPQPGPDGG